MNIGNDLEMMMKHFLSYCCTAAVLLLTPWTAAAQKPEMVVRTGHTGSVRSVAFSPDGKWLASGSEDHTIRLWNAATGEELRTLKGHTAAVMSVAFSPDGKWLASGSGDYIIKLWNTATGEQVRTLSGIR